MAVSPKRTQLHRQLLQAQDWIALDRAVAAVEAAFHGGEIDEATAEDLAFVSVHLSRHLPPQRHSRLAA